MNKSRKIVAALACRVNSSRLYAKPLQNLDINENLSVLDFLICNLKKKSEYINDICLGISNGIENDIFISIAQQQDISYIRGDKKDVLKRLIMCAESRHATDIFRVTTECPFIALEYLNTIHHKHITNCNDVTVLDGAPHGMHFEIYTLEALKKSHKNGTDAERSEYCSLHVRNNLNKFKVEVITPEPKFIRSDIRVTIDYPEDLILCREIYNAFKRKAFVNFDLKNIINYMDENKNLKEINKKYCTNKFIWL